MKPRYRGGPQAGLGPVWGPVQDKQGDLCVACLKQVRGPVCGLCVACVMACVWPVCGLCVACVRPVHMHGERPALGAQMIDMSAA